MLVVILVVAVVLGLTVAMLGTMRSRARDAASLSNLRSHSQAISAYTSDYADLYPYVTKVGFASTIFEQQLPPVSYFDAHRTWHRALAADYYSTNPRNRVFTSPHRVGGGRWLYTDYFYPCAYIAHPTYWNPYTRIGPSQYQPTRTDQVSYPAQKSLVVDSWWFATGQTSTQTTLIRLAAADGSGQVLTPIDINNGYPRGDGLLFQAYGAVHFADTPPGLHTIDGVRGRDVRQ